MQGNETMAEPSFESELARLFGETPHYSDQALFAAEVEQKLNRGWTIRRSLIGLLGLAGGLLAVGQVAGSNLVERMGVISQASVDAAHHSADSLPSLTHAASRVLAVQGLNLGGEAIWLVLGMLALAGVLLATRVVEEI